MPIIGRSKDQPRLQPQRQKFYVPHVGAKTGSSGCWADAFASEGISLLGEEALLDWVGSEFDGSVVGGDRLLTLA
jgi:hypothetical protein